MRRESIDASLVKRTTAVLQIQKLVWSGTNQVVDTFLIHAYTLISFTMEGVLGFH